MCDSVGEDRVWTLLRYKKQVRFLDAAWCQSTFFPWVFEVIVLCW